MNAERALLSSCAILTLACAAPLLSACRAGGSMSVERANDELRRRNLELEDRVAALEGTNAELGVKLEESEGARKVALPQDVLEAMPRCVGIQIGSLSGIERARAGRPARAIVDIEPTDARGRFVQIVGTLTVEAVVLPPAGVDNGSVQRFTAVLSPSQVRDAYRAGLLGTRYSVELPVQNVPVPGDVVLRAQFTDALSGHVFNAELTRPLPPESESGPR